MPTPPFGGKTPDGKYHRHLFNKSDVLEIIVVSELFSQGFGLKKVRGILEFIRHNSQQLAGDLYQTDGRTIWKRDLADAKDDHLINPQLPHQTVFLKWSQIQQKIGEFDRAS